MQTIVLWLPCFFLFRGKGHRFETDPPPILRQTHVKMQACIPRHCHEVFILSGRPAKHWPLAAVPVLRGEGGNVGMNLGIPSKEATRDASKRVHSPMPY